MSTHTASTHATILAVVISNFHGQAAAVASDGMWRSWEDSGSAAAWERGVHVRERERRRGA